MHTYTAEDLAGEDERTFVEDAIDDDDAYVSATEDKRDAEDADFTSSQESAASSYQTSSQPSGADEDDGDSDQTVQPGSSQRSIWTASQSSQSSRGDAPVPDVFANGRLNGERLYRIAMVCPGTGPLHWLRFVRILYGLDEDNAMAAYHFVRRYCGHGSRSRAKLTESDWADMEAKAKSEWEDLLAKVRNGRP
ncbi:hypothetical protein C8Q79DRAFT_69193 [Trametes meyenii]|nr:hypothetical protein C8Q79DRAFT_69193 [Trametes meyenii]